MKIPLTDEKPSEGDYYQSLEELIASLEKIDTDKICSLLLYGSIANGRFTVGRSDIHLCMVMDKDVITDKVLLTNLGDSVKNIVKKRKVELELSIYDMSILRDGRFFTFGWSFFSTFNSGKIIYGRDFRSSLNLLDYFKDREQEIGFNLRWLRKMFVEAPYIIENNSSEFAHIFKSFLQKIKNLENSVLDYIHKDIKNEVIRNLVKLASDYDRFDKERRNSKTALIYWKHGLTAYETVIKEIVHNYKRH